MTIEWNSGGVRLVGDFLQANQSHGVALLLHGGGQTRQSWASTARALQAGGWSAVTVDARGHGDSAWAPDGDYSMNALVADVTAIAGQIGVRPVLIGASMGGLTALLAVGEFGLPARGLVLVDVAPRVEPGGLERIRSFMAGAPNGFASLDEVVDAIAAYNPHRRRPPTPDGVRKNVRLGEDGRWRWHWDPAFLDDGDEPTRHTGRRRFVRAARKVRIPTLMVRGDQSDVVSAVGAAELLRTIPSSTEVVVHGAGHMVAGDDNSVFSRELMSFLGTVEQAERNVAAAGLDES